MDTKKLRQKILDLAIRGKLVPQDPNDEPASALLERIRAEKQQLIKEGKIKAPKGSKACDTSHYEKIEGPFEIPESWEWTTLGAIGQWQAGGTPSRGNKEYYGGNIPWLKTGDLNDGLVTNIPECITQKAIENSSAKLNPEGSILVAMYGATIGKLGILTFPATTNQACCACIEYSAVEQMYLFYFLYAHKGEFIRLGGGGAQPNISKDIIIKTPIPIPPIAEQKRIVAEIKKYLLFLEQIEDGRSSLEQAASNFKTKVLELAISGKLVPRDPSDEPAIQLLKRINPDFKPCDNSHYPFEIPDSWSLSTFGQLNNHQSKTINPLSEPEKTFELYSVPIFETGKPEILKGIEIGSTKQLVHKGEVLVCKINPHLNRVWVVEHYNTQMNCIASSEWIVFQHPALLPKYALLYFQSPYFRERLMSNVSGVGGSLMRARPSAVDGYILPIPPINEQRRIVQAVDKLLDNLSSISNFL